MSRKRSDGEAGAALAALHDAALVTAIFWTPIVWGQVAIAETHQLHQFTSSAGQALIAGLVGLAALAGALCQWVSGSRKWRLPNPVHLPAALLLAMAAVSTVFSLNHHASTIELARLGTGAAVFFLVANRRLLPASRPVVVAAALVCSAVLTFFIPVEGDPGLRLKAFSVIGLGVAATLFVAQQHAPDAGRWYRESLMLSAALVVACYGWYEKIMVLVEEHNPTWQIFSTFFNPNPLGGFLAMVFFLALSAALATRDLAHRLVWVFCALATGSAIYPTYSKGAMLAFAVAALLYVILLAWHHERTHRLARVVVIGGGVCLLVAVLAVAASPSLQQRASAAVSLQSSSNMFRILTWQGTVRMFAAHPWVGIGPAAFKYVYPRYAIAGYVEAAHQNYLQLFAELGVAGGLIFLWFLGAVLYTGGRAAAAAVDFRGRALAVGGVCALVVFLVHSLLDYDWYVGAINVTVWLVAGVLVYLSQPEQEPEPTPRKRVVSPPGRNVNYGVAVAVLCLAAYWGVSIPARNALAQRAIDEGDIYASSTQDVQRALYLAVTEYDRAKQYDPGWSEAWEKFGVYVGLMSQPERGVAALERAQSLTPMYYERYAAMGEFYSALSRYEEAAQAYQRAVELYPNYTKGRRKLAVAYEKVGDPERALAAYRDLAALEEAPCNRYRALETMDVDETFAYAHYAFGLRAQLQHGREPGRLQEALDEYQATLKIIGDYYEIGEPTDQMFEQLGRPRGYRRAEVRALHAKTLWRIAEILEQAGRGEEAKEERRTAAEAWRTAQAMMPGGLPELSEVLAEEEKVYG